MPSLSLMYTRRPVLALDLALAAPHVAPTYLGGRAVYQQPVP